MADNTLVIDVDVARDAASVPPVTDIESWVARAVAGAGRALAAGTEVSVRIVGEEESRLLNREYRGKDRATNVLSFPAGPVEGLPAGEPRVLGDLVVCAAVVDGEACAAGRPAAEHWAHIVVHGMLHLLGFDHETDSDAEVMEALETRILTGHGIPDPYGAEGRRTGTIPRL
ncbi:MAG TPA: rRNA maturation RNase YbeY [Woeseiaceae bacterium]